MVKREWVAQYRI